MQNLQRKRLKEWSGERLSLGITESGIEKKAISVPWENVSSAYGMRMPDIYISKEDLFDKRIMAEINRHKIQGLYIHVPLEDYEFLREFPQIKDLSIKSGENVKNLSFLEALTSCRMFYLESASLPDLEPMLKVKRNHRIDGAPAPRPFACVGLYNCEVKDLSEFALRTYIFSEFIVWNPKSRDERKRWKTIIAKTFRYYEIEEKETKKEKRIWKSGK